MNEQRDGLPEADLGDLGELDGFEVWDRTVWAPAGHAERVAYVSVRVGGIVALNRAAAELLGNPSAVKVMYDPKRHRLGVMPTSGNDPNSYYASTSPQLSCKRLFAYYGITITRARRYYDLRMVDGILVVDMAGASEVSPGRGAPARGPVRGLKP